MGYAWEITVCIVVEPFSLNHFWILIGNELGFVFAHAWLSAYWPSDHAWDTVNIYLSKKSINCHSSDFWVGHVECKVRSIQECYSILESFNAVYRTCRPSTFRENRHCYWEDCNQYMKIIIHVCQYTWVKMTAWKVCTGIIPCMQLSQTPSQRAFPIHSE